jgi:hypothetical protein
LKETGMMMIEVDKLAAISKTRRVRVEKTVG